MPIYTTTYFTQITTVKVIHINETNNKKQNRKIRTETKLFEIYMNKAEEFVCMC